MTCDCKLLPGQRYMKLTRQNFFHLISAINQRVQGLIEFRQCPCRNTCTAFSVRLLIDQRQWRKGINGVQADPSHWWRWHHARRLAGRVECSIGSEFNNTGWQMKTSRKRSSHLHAGRRAGTAISGQLSRAFSAMRDVRDFRGLPFQGADSCQHSCDIVVGLFFGSAVFANSMSHARAASSF